MRTTKTVKYRMKARNAQFIFNLLSNYKKIIFRQLFTKVKKCVVGKVFTVMLHP